jgi:sortase (surface protein transpeptidase)
MLKKLARILLIGSFLSFLLSTILSYPVFVFAWNVTFPNTAEKLSAVLSKPVEMPQQEVQGTFYIPAKNPSLTTVPTIRIPKIGIETEILEESLENYEFALQKGVWRVPNFGTPLEHSAPTILVAHRFGYLAWNQDYRMQNSFFNLPKLEVGDKVEVIWDQRLFEYEIYLKEENQEMTEYDADLILYTCKFLESDIRIFQYAKLIES